MKSQVLAGALCLALSGVAPSFDAAHAQTVRPINATNLKKHVAAQKGKVTIVNFWATWCPPCVAEMPSLSKLRRNYASRGLSLVLVSANESKESNSTVKPFLKKNALPSSWIVSGAPNVFIKGFDPKLKGAFELPRTYVYNRQGKLVQTFSGEKSYAQWQALLKPLL